MSGGVEASSSQGSYATDRSMAVDRVFSEEILIGSRHRRDAACGWHLPFLKGVVATLRPPPLVYRGNPRTNALVQAAV